MKQLVGILSGVLIAIAATAAQETAQQPVPPLRQQFYAPSPAGTLQIRATDLDGLRVHINELHDPSFDAGQLAADVVTADLSPYLVTGLNVIQYNPVGRNGRATVNVVVQ